MRKLLATAIAIAIACAGAFTANAHAESTPTVFGTRTGNVITFTNTTSQPGHAAINNGNYNYYYTAGKTATLTFSANAIGAGYSPHVTYTRVRVDRKGSWTYVGRYVFDGYNIWATIPAHSTVTVTSTP